MSVTVTSDQPRTRREAGCPSCRDGLGGATAVPRNGWRDRNVRSKPGLAQTWRIGVFVIGLLFMAFGCALVVLPGPLTIPPVLIGLWIWSSEFAWAHQFFTTFKKKAKATWAHAKQHPVSSTLVTVGGLMAAASVFWAVNHYQLIARGQQFLGL